MEKGMEYVLAVYEEHGFSKAAAKLFVTQPALSAIVKKEEQRYGLQFFNRRVTPLTLTEAGIKYINSALEIREIEQKLGKELQALQSLEQGTLRIGSSAFFCANELPKLADAFRKASKKPANINLLEGNTADLVQYLQKDTVDMVLSVDTSYGSKCQGCYLYSEMMLLVVPAEYPVNQRLREAALSWEEVKQGRYWEPDCPQVSLAEFQKYPFILLTKGNDSHKRIKKMFRNAGIRPQVLLEMDQMLTSYFIARDGKGVTMIRAEVISSLEATPKLVYYKVADPLAVRGVNLYYKKHVPLSPLAKAFMEFCQEEGAKYGKVLGGL